MNLKIKKFNLNAIILPFRTELFKIIYPLISVLLLGSCNSVDKNSFRISGKIEQLNQNYLILKKADDLHKQTTISIDSIAVNKRGEFNSVYFLEPDIYFLQIDNQSIMLAINKGQNIVINGKNATNITVKGSRDTDLLMAYENFRKQSLNKLVTTVRDSIKTLSKNDKNAELIVQLRELEVKNYQKHLNELVAFVEKNMGTSIGVCYSSIRWNGETNLPFLKTLVTNFEKAHPNQQIAKKVRNQLNLIEKTSVGSTLPNIAIPNVAADTLTLYSSLKRYTLVDFWASWCPPCRTESALLNSLYKKYNSIGFEIYAVSFDFNRDAWLNAIEKDSRVWLNVSSVSGFNTPISEELGITALPANLIVDSQGKIVAANIHGKVLEDTIINLFAN